MKKKYGKGIFDGGLFPRRVLYCFIWLNTGLFILPCLSGRERVCHIVGLALARVVSDLSLEDQQRVGDLSKKIGVGRRLESITKPYSDEMIEALLAALEQPSHAVQAHALALIEIVIRRIKIPQGVLEEKVIPQLRARIATQNSEKHGMNNNSTELTQRILWHAEVKSQQDEEVRRKLLKAALEEHSTAFYAMEYLVEMKDAAAQVILQEKLQKESAKAVYDIQFVNRLRESIEQLGILQTTRHMSDAEYIHELRDLLARYKDASPVSKYYFVSWLLRQLEKVNHPEAVKTLREIWQDPTFDELYREEAQESLLRLRVIQPHEQKRFFHD